MFQYKCDEFTPQEQTQRILFHSLQIFDFLCSCIIGGKCLHITKTVQGILPDDSLNPIIFVAIAIIGGGVVNPIYLVWSTECNYQIFPLLYVVTYSISPIMLQFINEMLQFYECNTTVVPFRRCANPARTLKYWSKFHAGLGFGFVVCGISEQILQQFGSNGEDNGCDHALVVIHTVLNVVCISLSLQSIIACYQFHKNVSTKSKDIITLKRLQLAFVVVTATAALAVHLLFAVINVMCTFTSYIARFHAMRVLVNEVYTVLQLISSFCGLFLALTFQRLARATQSVNEETRLILNVIENQMLEGALV